MKIYKHYSFDLWMTLIRSNPSFKPERTRFFFNHYNKQNKTEEEISSIFRQVDLMCNAINERTGGNIDAEEMYLMVISMMWDSSLFDDIDLSELYGEMELLVFRHLPVLYSSETQETLFKLKQTEDITFSLLSNTAFIKGSTLRQVLKKMGLNNLFDFQLYSDETGMSKPNKKLFQLMLNNINNLRSGINLSEIIHVGDNEKADIEGANAAGISSLLINSNSKSISSLLNYDKNLFLT